MQRAFWKQPRFWLLVALCMVVYFPLFMRMDTLTFRPWDEAILGVNAMEMADNHNPIVTYFYGKPDMSNCKPPLAIWLMAASSKVFGFSEFSLRLPSAIAALLLCLFLFYTLGKYARSYVFSFVVVAVLVSCHGYIRNHVTRTAEYDSLLVLFSCVFSIQLFLAVEAESKKQQGRHLFLFFAFLTLAVLTKGIACMMLAPGLFLYVLLRKKLWAFLKNRNTYYGLAVFLVFGIGYYFLRETMNPGYLLAVWQNELGGRFGAANEGHSGPFWFYMNEIVEWQLEYYKFLLPAGLLLGLFYAGERIKKLVGFSACVALFFLLVISGAQTKLPHYDAPMFPFLAVIIAALLYQIYILLKERVALISAKPAAFIAAFLLLSLMANPYYSVVKKVYDAKGDSWEEGFSRNCELFRVLMRGEVKLRQYNLAFDMGPLEAFGYANVLTCYSRMMKEHGKPMRIKAPNAFTAGEETLVLDSWMKHLMEQQYALRVLSEYPSNGVYYVAIDSVKTNAN